MSLHETTIWDRAQVPKQNAPRLLVRLRLPTDRRRMSVCDGRWVSVTTVLAIDQRVARTTAAVVDGAGNVLGRSERTLDLRTLPGGRVEQMPREVLGSVVDAGRAAVADAGVPIDVVALAPEGESVLAWDRDTGRPLSNLIVRPDRRAEEVRGSLAEHEEVIGERTGRALTADHPALKLAWLRRHVTTAGVATTSDSWLLHQLTGEFVTEASTASRSFLVDPDTGSWDRDLIGLFGLAEQPMPTILSSDRIVGSTIAFGGTVLVGGLINNGTATMLGEGCLEPAGAVCTFGSGATLSANAGTTDDAFEHGFDEVRGMARQGRDDPLHQRAGRHRGFRGSAG